MVTELPSLPTFASGPVAVAPAPCPEERMAELAAELRQSFLVDFALIDVSAHALLGGGDEAGQDAPAAALLDACDLYGAVLRGRRAEIIAQEDPVALLAIPVPEKLAPNAVAVAGFLTRTPKSFAEVEQAVNAMGLSCQDRLPWLQQSEPWSMRALVRMAELTRDRLQARWRNDEAEGEVEQITTHLLNTYEEISLLHRLAQNLKISRSDTSLAKLALQWVSGTVPAEGLVLHIKSTADDPTLSNDDPSQWVYLTHGEQFIEQDEFDGFVECLGREARYIPIVLNRPVTSKPSWPYPQVREVISVPLTENGTTFGWLVAVNHSEEIEFGTVEASLLSSVAAILAIHRGNTELYRQQAEFLAGVVRAMTAAIDAKDPYTCGHSDRVARISVRLGEELGLEANTLHTIYLSGLLHDIGKIGIDDQILRKPGRLTEAEFEHIKLHPELGYKILRDIKKLDQILPVVLHHHEAWNGQGYPHGLAGEDIPLLARIVAVADSFDAMSSDRPYRKGMPLEKMESILLGGAGKQWDPEVINAYKAARKDIIDLARRERDNLRLDFQNWH